MQMTLPFFESLFTLLQPIRKINNGYFLPSFTWSLSLPRECSAAPLQHNFHRPYITLNSNLIYKQHTFRSSGGWKHSHQIVTPCCSQDRLNQNQVMTAIRGVSRPRQDQDFERSRPRPAQDPIGVTRNNTWNQTLLKLIWSTFSRQHSQRTNENSSSLTSFIITYITASLLYWFVNTISWSRSKIYISIVISVLQKTIVGGY